MDVDEMKYVTVGFKVEKENSVYYNKTFDKEQFHQQIDEAIEKDADFISLRIVKDGGKPANPESQTKINPDMLTCIDCKKAIPECVAKYSQDWYGKHLCRDCQLKHRKQGESP